MKIYFKAGGITLLILTVITLVCYSPLTASIYEDWKSARAKRVTESRVATLMGQNGQVRSFTEEGGALIASSVTVDMKPMSEDRVGLKMTVDPAHPVRATVDDHYRFTLKFEDEDGFEIVKNTVLEWEMTPAWGGQ